MPPVPHPRPYRLWSVSAAPLLLMPYLCCHVDGQVFFSSKNPLIRWRLPLLHKWLYNNGTYSYFCTVITTWTFLLVPFISLMFQIQPVKFSKDFAIAATIYLLMNMMVSTPALAAGAGQSCPLHAVSGAPPA